MPTDVMQNKLNISLYDNVLTPEKDDYIGKVQLNGTMTNEHIARKIVSQRTEYRYETILQILNMGSEVKRDSLVGGFAINDGVFQSYPAVWGKFIGSTAQFDPKVHTVGVTAVPSAALRKAMVNTKVVVQGPATTGPVINRIEDVYSQTTNEMITPGRNVLVYGQHLRVGGDKPEIGIYFIDATNETNRTRVDDRDVVVNNPSQLTIVVPTLPVGNYYIEVVTQQSTGNQTLLKEARSVRFELSLEVI